MSEKEEGATASKEALASETKNSDTDFQQLKKSPNNFFLWDGGPTLLSRLDSNSRASRVLGLEACTKVPGQN